MAESDCVHCTPKLLLPTAFSGTVHSTTYVPHMLLQNEYHAGYLYTSEV